MGQESGVRSPGGQGRAPGARLACPGGLGKNIGGEG